MLVLVQSFSVRWLWRLLYNLASIMHLITIWRFWCENRIRIRNISYSEWVDQLFGRDICSVHSLASRVQLQLSKLLILEEIWISHLGWTIIPAFVCNPHFKLSQVPIFIICLSSPVSTYLYTNLYLLVLRHHLLIALFSNDLVLGVVIL